MAAAFELFRPVSACPFCGSRARSAAQAFSSRSNRYLDALASDVSTPAATLTERMQAFQCDECRVVYCDPWLSDDARKWLYDVASPQHSVGWGWFFGWTERDKRYREQLQPRLLALWSEVCRVLPGTLTTYAEVNCPFTGFLPTFAEVQDPALGAKEASAFFKSQQAKRIHPQSLQQLTLPRLRLKERLSAVAAAAKPAARATWSLPTPAQRSLVLAPSHSIWGRNCSALGTSCHATAQGMLGVSLLHLDELKKQREPLDVLAFMNTLDHTDEPLQVLESAVNHARLVVIENHDEVGLEKQHLWGFSHETMPHICRKQGWQLAELTSKLPGRKQVRDRVYLISKDLRFD